MREVFAGGRDRKLIKEYEAKGEGWEDLGLMRRLDEPYREYPFYGSRQLMRQLRREGVTAGRHRIRRLIRWMAPG